MNKNDKIYKTRLAKLVSVLKAEYSGAVAVFSSNPPTLKTGDRNFPYRPNNDLFYLTGLKAEDLALVIRPEKTPSLLLLGLKEDPIKTIWEGKPEPVAPKARALGVEYQEVSNINAALMPLTRGSTKLLFQSHAGTSSKILAAEILALGAHERVRYPGTLIDSEFVMGELRLCKDPSEVQAIERAARLTAESIHEILPLLQDGIPESDIAHSLNYMYTLGGGCPGFETILASGPSAATLHYHSHTRLLKKGEMVLVDTGAELDMYSADITRTLPVLGKYSGIQAELYDVVLEAHDAAMKAAKPGVRIADVYTAASKILLRGLIAFGVIKKSGKAEAQLLELKKYFPHGIGHSLGLDVHDEQRLRSGNGPKLAPGMVITIEPGLYFSKPIKKLPACGVRIEDNIVITKNGCRDLTGGLFPVKRKEIEALWS